MQAAAVPHDRVAPASTSGCRASYAASVGELLHTVTATRMELLRTLHTAGSLLQNQCRYVVAASHHCRADPLGGSQRGFIACKASRTHGSAFKDGARRSSSAAECRPVLLIQCITLFGNILAPHPSSCSRPMCADAGRAAGCSALMRAQSGRASTLTGAHKAARTRTKF
eukprot:7383974-Prymnesium_polylepis.4